MAIRMWPSVKGTYPMDLKCTACSGRLNNTGKVTVHNDPEKELFRAKHAHGLSAVTTQLLFQGWRAPE